MQQRGQEPVKLILLGDSEVGKSRLAERFVADEYEERSSATLSLRTYSCRHSVRGEAVVVDVWDTAGAERFDWVHPSYYADAHACLLVFDSTRVNTYKNLRRWYAELRGYLPNVPCVLLANKIDVDYERATGRCYLFAQETELPLYFVSAADGTNVAEAFEEALEHGLNYKIRSRLHVQLLPSLGDKLEELHYSRLAVRRS